MSQHGIAGIYKGQVPTLAREAIGYGAYFWAYEKLMQREQRKGVKREDVSPVKAVLFGAAAGYAVRIFTTFLRDGDNWLIMDVPVNSSGFASTQST